LNGNVLSVSLSGAVTALLNGPVSSSYDQDADLDVTQTDVILDNVDILGLDVDFSYVEDDESDGESASWGPQSCDDRDENKLVLPSITSAIQSSIDYMLASDSDGMHSFHTF